MGSSSLVSGSTKSQFSSDSMAVVMHDACCNWSSCSAQQPSPVIDHITLALPKGSLVAVIGEVGFLNDVLGLSVDYHVDESQIFLDLIDWV